MIKNKGDKKVEDYFHGRSGVETAIYLRGTQFVAVLLEREFSAPDVAILRKKLTDYAEAWISLEWFPILEIEVEKDRYSYRDEVDGEDLTFKRKRFYIGTSPAGEIFTVDWDVDEDHRKAQMKSLGGGYRRERNESILKLTGLPLKAPLKRSEGNYLIDYTEELWEKTEGIVRGIATLRKMINQLFTSRKGIEQLLANGAEKLLLPSRR